ncbi:nucleotidyltransferase family protein [Acinetobacter nectaris]|uniref:nucleotidyltransferase family protein n=1 Tax=Acinetobacter nectaris TaxID=1219382 RepID=UPI002241BEC7|nr:nucleotidyltransferase family protein [Acinetobacter nectaris]
MQHHIAYALHKKFPFYEWDVVNQAKVHCWYKTDPNESIEPLCSIWHALSLWPETATAIAIRLTQDHKIEVIEVIAPFWLVDLFDLKLRWNKNLVSESVFNQRIIRKNFIIRWPNLTIEKPFKAGVFLEEKPTYKLIQHDEFLFKSLIGIKIFKTFSKKSFNIKFFLKKS